MTSSSNMEVLRMMDELANTTISLKTGNRLAQISYVRIEQEILYSLSRHLTHFECVHLTGSMYEGIDISACNDQDQMENHKFFPTVELEPPEEKGKCGFVIAEQNSVSEPAYLRLKAVDEDCLHDFVKRAIDKDKYLNTVDFLKLFSPMPNTQRRIEIHGPAFSYHNIADHTLDAVPCLKSNIWPSVAEEFFTRKRLNKWPTNVLKKIREFGCLVVAVGHPSSASKEIEWRWSFSVAEKVLLQEMKGSLPKCIFTLKALKKLHICYEESDKPTPFCSYFIKTACLWMYESIPHEDYSTMDLIRKLLNWLIECYEIGNLRHYFIPSQNLIGHLPKEVCEDVQKKLKTINSTSLWRKVMSCIGNGQYERQIFNSMCHKLGIAKVSEGDDYGQMETNLLNHPRAKEELENVIRQLSPGDYIHDKYQFMGIVTWLSREFPSLIRELHVLIEYKVEASKILALPRSVIMPIIHMLGDLLPDGYGPMFQQHLLRYLGDVYTYLLICLKNRYGSVAVSDLSHYEEPIYYYELGALMVFPDKWGDSEMGSIILKAKYYYLTGDHENLNKILKAIGPEMPFINEETMNRHINIEIKNTLHLCLSAWAVDEEMQNLAIEFGPIFKLHPVVFVFYMQARVAIEKGDVENATEHLNNMKKCIKKILVCRTKNYAMSVIKIIENKMKSFHNPNPNSD